MIAVSKEREDYGYLGGENLDQAFFTLNTAKHDMMKNTLKVIDCKKLIEASEGKKALTVSLFSASGF